MRLGTRLLLLLLPTVLGIMTVFTMLSLRSRQATLVEDTRLETQAYARALAVALDYAIRSGRRQDIQEIINQVTEVPTIYGIVVYDRAGTPLFTSTPQHRPGSAPAGALAQVLKEGGQATFERRIEGQRVLSVLRAIHGPRRAIAGALEVAQPLAPIEAEVAGTQRRWMLTTLTLLVAITLVTLGIVRRTITRPLGRLVAASEALGSGDLGYRLEPRAAPGELGQVARAFNGMAASLEQTQAAVAREAEERFALEHRLRETEKLAAIGNLAAGLAHEIAAPLNVISGRAEMLLKRDPGPGDRERQLRIIVQQITRITGIVRNLLDFARPREPQHRRLDLATVLHGVEELLEQELARAEVTLAYAGTGAARVEGDPDLLHQVFVNLYLNAVQAMATEPGPRRLVVRVATEAAGADGAAVVAVVEDTGPGIDPEILDTIFDPFVTTKARGTGLGLVVARRIVQEHGGELRARNGAAGRGAIFEVRLPAADAPGVPSPASHEESHA
ncbi:MAG TPA: ATP-binding protein [Gemmatimonadales bacterium]|nr:ATP-binding protein [Gemmatimonadales bacterium]